MSLATVHWTILLCLPTEVPALSAAFSRLSTPELVEAVSHDLKVCRGREEPDAEEAHIIEHLSLFANEELERRGESYRF